MMPVLLFAVESPPTVSPAMVLLLLVVVAAALAATVPDGLMRVNFVGGGFAECLSNAAICATLSFFVGLRLDDAPAGSSTLTMVCGGVTATAALGGNCVFEPF